MTQRIDSIYGHAEAFAYDAMNRLTAGGSDAYAYDTKGNVTYRDGVGSILTCAECGRPAIFPFEPFGKVAAEIYINAIMYGVDYYTRDFGIFENLYMITAPSFLKAYRNMNTNHTYPILFVPNTIKILLFNEK